MKKTKKTIKEWLETLPDGYRELAIKNYDPSYADGWEPVNSLALAISEAFYWGGSPEGFEFWANVGAWALGASELPLLREEEK